MPRRDRNFNIDVGLAALSKHNKHGQQMTLDDMAYVCGCNRERIRQIQEQALRKIRYRLMESQDAEELRDQLRATL